MTIISFFRAHFGNPEPDLKRTDAMGVTIRYGLIEICALVADKLFENKLLMKNNNGIRRLPFFKKAALHEAIL
ncbi:hypothetical protein ACM0P6_12805 [Komagataeibacter sucrofermentans]|uniref:hypothetical protein n=1 Tax=Komagataeibacter sucrofermentans TaxID=1053551 RepID=UPI0011B80113|nr:hypothetical protein [Komagataeibacter sucrofermentans]GBQ44366.1 hypothetical protein AA15973_0282 [Komagataeibacter sucrofermentans DSM 15973]